MYKTSILSALVASNNFGWHIKNCTLFLFYFSPLCKLPLFFCMLLYLLCFFCFFVFVQSLSSHSELGLPSLTPDNRTPRYAFLRLIIFFLNDYNKFILELIIYFYLLQCGKSCILERSSCIHRLVNTTEVCSGMEKQQFQS